jgi:aristolochene synthase
MASFNASLYSKLVRRLRDFLPRTSDKPIAVATAPVLSSTKGSSTSPPAPKDRPYLSKDLHPTTLTPQLHPDTQKIFDETHGFFIKHWPFKTETHKQRFCDEGYAWFNCILCPMELDDRMVRVCKFFTTGFLIDDMLDRMSVEERKAHNAGVIACCSGERLPDREKPAEWIMYDLFQKFRQIDKPLSDMLLKYTIDFFEAQTNADRSNLLNLQEYFEYRYADLGKGYVRTLSHCARLIPV